MVVQGPGLPAVTGAVKNLPWYGRGEETLLPAHGDVTASYTTYARSPPGDIAGAVYMGRSLDGETETGACQVPAPSVDHDTRACSWLIPALASDQASMIVLVAPAPVGAPFATSTAGVDPMSVRVPV